MDDNFPIMSIVVLCLIILILAIINFAQSGQITKLQTECVVRGVAYYKPTITGPVFTFKDQTNTEKP